MKTSGTLAAGDVIRVIYSGAPDLNLTQKVRSDGYVSLPMIGNVKVSGKSLSAVQGELRGKYKAELQDPKVVVTLEQAAALVYVSGEVNRPGKVALDRPLTAFEAIMEAGGFAPTANRMKVGILRTENGQRKRYTLRFDGAFTEEGSLFYLRPYDVVHVDQRMW